MTPKRPASSPCVCVLRVCVCVLAVCVRACVCQREGAHLYLSIYPSPRLLLCTMVACCCPPPSHTHTHTHTHLSSLLGCHANSHFRGESAWKSNSRCWGNPGSVRPLLSGTHTCSLPIHALIIICIRHEYITSTPCAGDV